MQTRLTLRLDLLHELDTNFVLCFGEIADPTAYSVLKIFLNRLSTAKGGSNLVDIYQICEDDDVRMTVTGYDAQGWYRYDIKPGGDWKYWNNSEVSARAEGTLMTAFFPDTWDMSNLQR